jgi:hypothetical protein
MPQVSNAILFGTVLAPVALSTKALRDRGSGADSFADVREGPEEETRAGRGEARQRMGRVKRGAMLLVKIVATLAITVGLAEAASYIMYERLAHRPFSMERIQAELGTPTDGPQFASDDRAAPAHRFRRPFMWDKALHPYLGFAYRPDESTPTNSFGFFGPSPVMTPRPGHAVAGLFGGSVALGLCMNPDHGTKLIAEAIARSAFFHGKTIDVVCLAVDGYKQPQQLLALTYLLALGVRFDVVINLDGFNEAVLPVAENVPEGVFPFYPREWKLYSHSSFSPEVAPLIADMLQLRTRRQRLQKLASYFPLRNSVTALTVWDVTDNRLKIQELAINSRAMDILASSRTRDENRGPWAAGQSVAPEDLVRVWRDSSAQMERLARTNGFKYFHFLQPNQYVADSKVLSREERTIAVAIGLYPYRTAVQNNYPAFIREGSRLRELENFTDLTPMFAFEARTVYADTCCHFNELGTDLISYQIAHVVAQRLNDDHHKAAEATRVSSSGE